MEAQFRRLWPRRKSLKRFNKPDVKDVPQVPSQLGFEYNKRYEATVSGPAPEVGTLPLKPSDEAKAKKSFGHSKAQSTGLQEFRAVAAKDVHSRATSTGGIQPVLVGISRPFTSRSTQQNGLGGTDSIIDPGSVPGAPRLNTAASLPESRTAHRFQPVPVRHVDIMSFANATGNHRGAYNEEVAARNLDLKTLAKESATTTYVPRSHYQEDVAARNAGALGYRYKPSAPMQSVPEGHRSNSLHSRGVPSTSTSASLPGYGHEDVPVPAIVRTMQDSTMHHSRAASATSRTSNSIPAIPQALSISEEERAIPWLESQNQVPLARRREEVEESEIAFTRYPSMHADGLASNPSQSGWLPPFPKSMTRANESRPMHGHPPSSNPYDDPVAEYMEPGQRSLETRYDQLPTRRTASKSSQYREDDLMRKLGIPSSRGSSTDRGRPVSSINHRRDMSNRTFMDLTSDELERQSQPHSPRTEYHESPVLAQATADTVQRRKPHLINANSAPYQDNTSAPGTADYGSFTGTSLRAPHQQPNRWPGIASTGENLQGEQPLAFSAVTTLSSMSPASQSVERTISSAHGSSLSKSREDITQSSKDRRALSSDNSRTATVEKATDRRQTAIWNPAGNTRAPVSYLDTPPQTNPEEQARSKLETPQMLYTSPESLNSGDFVDPSRSFGVLTRDFAATPSRQSAALRQHTPKQQSYTGVASHATPSELSKDMSQSPVPVEQRTTPRRHLGYEYKPNGTSRTIEALPVINEPERSPQLDHVDTPIKELNASSFDEIEYARKQAQARAALLRLQMSLEEQYDMSPGRPDSSTQRHVARQILDQNRKPLHMEKQASQPPTSMYYEKKEYQSKAKANRPAPIHSPSAEGFKSGSGYSYEKAGPNSFAQSVYSAVTIAPSKTTKAQPNGYIKSSAAGSASHSYNYANGGSGGVGINGGFRASAASNLPNPPLTPVLPSPAGTEVSLSSFPMPTAQSPPLPPQSPLREMSQRGRRPWTAAEEEERGERPRTARMHSTKSSVNSISSVYSIPHHMVPARDSSRRDTFDEEF